ncbi:alpha amylase catalytic region [Paenibacillus algicola]|uniref:Alpha-amylase n=1 Tax=Paenibacillus algicola TaxID=2565926 RepID=A0A4P8XG51_9BACL|nr:alpha-amylase family glycosyl hydrolase [Paenibacillus algicola]QCT01178.1 alpha amylase catalytic region [Paenibacillus algicola]
MTVKSKQRQATRKWAAAALSALLAGGIVTGCGSGKEAGEPEGEMGTAVEQPAAEKAAPAEGGAGAGEGQESGAAAAVDEQPSEVYYEIFVRSFADSNGDGIGDLNGIISKLDYLNDGKPETTDDLGVTGIWLMPVNPSPSYHGYDVTDYRNIHPEYGTLEDFRRLMDEAHKRGIKIIMDLVVNHSSVEHPWFLEASSDVSSDQRDWYVWAEDQGKEPTGVSAAGGGNPWHEKNGAHYLGIFWGGMPDLNLDNPDVQKEMKDIGQFWLKQGVDGFRLDAAKHIYEDLAADKSESTTAKNTAWWQDFRKSMDEVNPDAYIVGEVWENSAASIAPYLHQAFDSGFNFGLAEKILSAVQSGKDNNLAFTLERTYGLFSKVSGGQFTDAVFLANHDQNRVMTQLRNQEEQAKMAAGILLTLPGNPFIYYGEEIGMQGAKPDERIREPMVWSSGEKDAAQTNWEPMTFNGSGRTEGVSEQLQREDSLLVRYRNLIRWRNDLPALRDGNIGQYASGHGSVMAYTRSTEKLQALVMHNLSGDEVRITLDEAAAGGFTTLSRSTSEQAVLQGRELSLPGYTTVVLE